MLPVSRQHQLTMNFIVFLAKIKPLYDVFRRLLDYFRHYVYNFSPAKIGHKISVAPVVHFKQEYHLIAIVFISTNFIPRATFYQKFYLA